MAWLNRNLPINNKDHLDLSEAMDLVHKLMRMEARKQRQR